MKNLVFILLLFPALLSAQKDSTILSLKASKGGTAMIEGISGEKANRKLILAAGKLSAIPDSIKITGFTVNDSITLMKNCDGANNSPWPLSSDNEYLTQKMSDVIDKMPVSDYCTTAYLKFYNIKYITPSGVTGLLNNIILIITE